MTRPVPEIILGPPGTGKTTRLLGIVEEELQRGTDPKKIGYVSFTRKAADEARDRACERFGLPRSRLPYFRTIHSLAFNQLGISRNEVFEGSWVQEFARGAGIKIKGRWSEDGSLNGFEVGDRALFIENLARVRCVGLREQYNASDEDDLTWHELDRIRVRLDAFKRANGLLDYTDMLEQYLAHGSTLDLDILVVDEAQDLSQLQWRIVQMISARCRRVVVAGDDDQAIYPWAGADVDAFVQLEGRVQVLHQSWRVPRSVQKIAGDLVGRIRNRRSKEWVAREEDGVVDRAHTIDDADLSGSDVLVLARNTYILHQVEQSLRRQGILYERQGVPSIPPVLLEAIVSWERLRVGEELPVDDARSVYKYMSSAKVSRGARALKEVGDAVNIETLAERGGLLTRDPWFDAMDRIAGDDRIYIQAARQHGERITKKPRVRLSTIHASKGGQAEHVVLMTEIARRTAREQEHRPDDELRCWYVAVTRAKERLTIVNPSTQTSCLWL